jgi:hypothetical protein
MEELEASPLMLDSPSAGSHRCKGRAESSGANDSSRVEVLYFVAEVAGQ